MEVDARTGSTANRRHFEIRFVSYDHPVNMYMFPREYVHETQAATRSFDPDSRVGQGSTVSTLQTSKTHLGLLIQSQVRTRKCIVPQSGNPWYRSNCATVRPNQGLLSMQAHLDHATRGREIPEPPEFRLGNGGSGGTRHARRVAVELPLPLSSS
jgi:hypothetical protein